MIRSKIKLAVLMWALLLVPATYAQAAKEAPKPPRAIDLNDILEWKRIQSGTLSNDGQWFAYRLSPTEGDGEVIIRRTGDNKEVRFPAGEAQPFGPAGALAFSENSKWLAFTIFPDMKEAKKLKKEKKPLYNKVALVDLASGKKVEFEKVRAFAFSGQQSGWVALHKYVGESQEKEKDKWAGSDLILHELATGNQLNVGNVAEFAFDKKGQWLAWAVDAQDKSGNGLQLRNMGTGGVTVLDSDKANYKSLSWTEKGEGLAALKGVEDKSFEDKLYSVVAFTDLSASPIRKVTYDPREDKSFPAAMTVSPNRSPAWTDDMSGLLFGIHDVKKKVEKGKPADKKDEKAKDDQAKDAKDVAAQDRVKKPEEAEQEKPDLVVWHYRDRRLQAQQQVEEMRDKNFSYLSLYRVGEKRFKQLADADLRQVVAAPKHKYAIGLDDDEYELMGNLDGRRYQDVYVFDLKTGAKRLAVKKSRWYYGASPDGTHFLYYDDGHFYTHDMTTGQSHNITERVPSVFFDQEDDHNITKPPRGPLGWTKDGVSVLLSDGWDVWNVPVHGGQATNLTVNGKKDGLRYRTRYRLDPEEKGIDLSGPVYFWVIGDTTKKTGIARVDGGKPGAKMLLWGEAGYGGLIKAKSADKMVFTKDTFKDYPDYYASDNSLQNGQRLTEANPQQKNFLWSKGSMLVNYTSAKGDKLQAALYLPANYEQGKSYPTIVYIYEKLTEGLNRYTTPSANGFNKSVYTSRGYAVLMPDIVYKINDPGMSAVWCVLPALDAAVATGVVDKSRVGLHGHSWGGYQTAFLITQTDAFKAAVAGAPLTNMISMYSSVYWNTGSANQSIFESSQGRFTGGYWENMDAYMRNSPVFFAKNVKTPLLLLHNDKDGAVDWNQGIEYFNTLRRLQKPVVLLQYKGENHGLRQPANMKDYTVRMREFFDHHLMGKPAPAWLVEGVPHLKLKDHLEERASEKPVFDDR